MDRFARLGRNRGSQLAHPVRVLWERINKQTLAIHYAAWALAPQTLHFKFRDYELLRVEAFLQQVSPVESWQQIQMQLYQFRVHDGPVFGPGSGNVSPSQKPYDL